MVKRRNETNYTLCMQKEKTDRISKSLSLSLSLSLSQSTLRGFRPSFALVSFASLISLSSAVALSLFRDDDFFSFEDFSFRLFFSLCLSLSLPDRWSSSSSSPRLSLPPLFSLLLSGLYEDLLCLCMFN